jgi:hypothetical protein
MRHVIVLIMFAGLPFSARAQWQNNGVPVSTEIDIQLYPAIIADGVGGAIIAWQDHRGGTTADIYVQRVNAAGFPLWTAGGVALCTAANGQHAPKLAPDGEGGAIVTWQDYRSGTADIYAQRVNSTGSPKWTADGVAVCAAPLNVFLPEIVSDGTFGAIITWYDARSGMGFDVYAQRLNSEGFPQWTVDGVGICVAANHQYTPTLVRDGASGAIIVWYDERNVDRDIYAQRVDDVGSVQWATDGEKVCTATNDQIAPTIVAVAASGAIITWYDYRAGAASDIYAQRLDALGDAQWALDGIALCDVAGDQDGPTIDSDGVGGAIVTWSDYRGGATADVYAQRVNASGTPLWTPGGVALCTAAGGQSNQTIVQDGAGGAIVTWYDERWGFSDVFAQRVDASGVPQWTSDGVAICTAASYQFVPRIASDGAAGAIVTWFDDRDGNYDVYAHRVDASGVAADVAGPTRGPVLIASEIYPNPFSRTAWVDIEVVASSAVRIDVYDVAGRAVRTMTLANAVGTRRIEFDGRDEAGRLLPSGVYFCRMQANEASITRKMVIAR